MPRAPHDAVAEGAVGERGTIMRTPVGDGVDLSLVLHHEARPVAAQLKLLRRSLQEVRDFAHDSLDHLLLWATRSGADGSHSR